MKFLKID